jgi:hypothetical protein
VLSSTTDLAGGLNWNNDLNNGRAGQMRFSFSMSAWDGATILWDNCKTRRGREDGNLVGEGSVKAPRQ